jgi:hypothetical protein
MKTISKTIPAAIGALMISALSLSAASTDALSLQGLHQLSFSGGALTESDTSDDQLIGGFEYHYWTSENLAVGASFAGITTDEDDNDDYWRRRDESVGMAHASVLLRPDFLNLSSKAFFTLQASAGPYVGSKEYRRRHSDKHDDRWERETETRWGGYLGANFNLAITERFHMGLAAGYHFIPEFDDAINGQRDYSSPDVRLRFNFLIGKRS